MESTNWRILSTKGMYCRFNLDKDGYEYIYLFIEKNRGSFDLLVDTSIEKCKYLYYFYSTDFKKDEK